VLSLEAEALIATDPARNRDPAYIWRR